MGRPPLGKVAMTSTERGQRWRKKHRQTKPETGRGAIEIDWPSPIDRERAREAFGAMIRKLKETRRARRIRLPSVKRIERESGKVVTEVTYRPDGSRTVVLGEKSDVSGVEIDTPEQLRRLI